MKQVFHITALLILILTITAATLRAGSKVEVGPILGHNISRFFGDDIDYAFGNDTVSNITSYCGGASVRVNFSKYFAIRPEIMFIRKGAEFAHVDPSNDTVSLIHSIVRLDYIELPVLALVRGPVGNRVGFYVAAGPSVALAVSNDLEFRLTETTGGETIVDDQSLAVADIYNVKNVQVGWTFAFGMDLQLGRYRLSYDGRYSSSFNNAFTDVPDRDAVPDGQAALVHLGGDAYKLKSKALTAMVQISYSLGL